MSDPREGRVIQVQLLRDGQLTTIGVPNDEPEHDDEAVAVGLVKLLRAVFGERADAVLAAMFDFRTDELGKAHDPELN